MDLLSALAPRVATPDASLPAVVAPLAPELSARVGVLPLVLAAGKGVQAGLKWVQSPKGQRFLKQLGDSAKRRERRLRTYQSRAEKAKSPAARKRWQRRARRQQERIDDLRLTATLAQKGIVTKPAQLEYKRNLLAMEWEEADAGRKKEIEGRIKRMDKRLKKLAREQRLLEQTLAPKKAEPKAAVPVAAPQAKAKAKAAGEEVYGFVPHGRERRRLARLPRAAIPNATRALVNADKRILSGMGGMRFDVQAPPGPGRLIRIPFYAENSAFTWSGANGIDFVEDDPVTMLVLDSVPVPQRNAKPLLLRTERFDYGSFRILGFQCNEQGNYPSTNFLGGNPGNNIIVISFRNLQLYNGQTLFLQPDEVWSATFDIFPSDIGWSGLTPSPFPGDMQMQLPNQYAQRRSRWFTGLRDYPIVTGTTFVSVEVRAFSVFPTGPEEPRYEIPITCNVIGEMVEDRVFGDPVNPSPAARAGATVKVAARETGLDVEGDDQLELVAARHRRLVTE